MGTAKQEAKSQQGGGEEERWWRDERTDCCTLSWVIPAYLLHSTDLRLLRVILSDLRYATQLRGDIYQTHGTEQVRLEP